MKIKKKEAGNGPFKKKRFLLHFGSGVAQLVDRSLPTPEVSGLNPVIGTNFFECLLSTVLEGQK